MREWMRTRAPAKEGAITEGMAGWGILGRLRGSERARSQDWKWEVEGLLKNAGTVDDIKAGLEAALFRLGREGSENGGGGGARVGQIKKDRADGVGESEAEGEAETEKKKNEEEVSATDASKLDIIFDEALGKEKSPRKLCRYQLNPRPNWGPMNRAAGS
ncbi:hypothetical protein GJ744_002562 [Endocarpon pusillum]|uniref:Uncharacterized protein n=1 Tax=Endocarpon pusillum TaxID=364733 RepID=A0A8H7A7T0_9EURO|nr:hypothetical protein GJ744_002562 [Endocarpon pusillum]